MFSKIAGYVLQDIQNSGQIKAVLPTAKVYLQPLNFILVRVNKQAFILLLTRKH